MPSSKLTTRMISVFLLSVMFLVSATVLFSQVASQDTQKYFENLRKFRAEQESLLIAEDGWLSLCGLYWLTSPDLSLGTGKFNKILLPEHVGIESAAIVSLVGDLVEMRLRTGVTANFDGKPFTGTGIMYSPTDPMNTKPHKVSFGSVSMFVIIRGKRIGLRMYDSENPRRKSFEGMKWAKPNLNFQITADFHTYDPPHKLDITNVLGDTAPVDSPGYVTFEINGKKCRLETQSQGNGLFINFHDLTSGKETYPAGRFLETDAPKDGKVILDFNRAVNPPCAFTEFATCPLAPKVNYLQVRIPVGELNHHPK